VDPTAPAFSVTVANEGDTVRISLKGELDMASVDGVRRALEDAEALPVRLVALDLSELTFVDSTGLEVFLRAARRARESGRRLVVARPSVYVRKLLQLTAIDQALDVVDDVV
jgi:anti-sigma B factor antagonist